MAIQSFFSSRLLVVIDDEEEERRVRENKFLHSQISSWVFLNANRGVGMTL